MGVDDGCIDICFFDYIFYEEDFFKGFCVEWLYGVGYFVYQEKFDYVN